MAVDTAAIVGFWSWFREHSAELYAMPDADARFWDTALAELHRVDARMQFEISDPVNDRREFVITARGDPSVFASVEALVAAAPGLSEWIVVALKPPCGFDFATTYEGVEFDARRLWFLPLHSANRPDDVGLRVGVPGLSDAHRSIAARAVIVILETGLGERSLAIDVQHVEYAALPEEPAKHGWIELPELPAYIAWRKSKRSHG